MLGIPSSRQNFPRVSEQEDPPSPSQFGIPGMHTSRGEASFPPFLRTHVPFHACPSAKKEGGGEKESLHTAQLSTLSAPFSSHPLSFSANLGPIPKKKESSRKPLLLPFFRRRQHSSSPSFLSLLPRPSRLTRTDRARRKSGV